MTTGANMQLNMQDMFVGTASAVMAYPLEFSNHLNNGVACAHADSVPGHSSLAFSLKNGGMDVKV